MVCESESGKTTETRVCDGARQKKANGACTKSMVVDIE